MYSLDIYNLTEDFTEDQIFDAFYSDMVTGWGFTPSPKVGTAYFSSYKYFISRMLK